MDHVRALEILQMTRYEAKPNNGFMEQLRKWHAQNTSHRQIRISNP